MKTIVGLENLALIPGLVGSAPVQNISAYGVELKQVCEYVDILLLDSGEKRHLSAAECKFAYRDSIFKHVYRENCAIISVGLRLKKLWQPVLNYGDLVYLDKNNVTPYRVFDAVCNIRRNKLPDPAQIGNAGSFFKSHILMSTERAAQLFKQYPCAARYPQSNGDIIVAAAWFIDRCGLKGFTLGDAAVYNKHALVLVNNGRATGHDIAALAKIVCQQVVKKFFICLEPEVRLIAHRGEISWVSASSLPLIFDFSLIPHSCESHRLIGLSEMNERRK